jgi:predicted amino acid dehydrogenase
LVMPLVEDNARRIGVELQDLLEGAAAVVGHPGTVQLARWLSCKPQD